MQILKWLLFGSGALAVLVLLAAQLGAFSGQAPANLGVRDGRLKPPSKTPNSVSSQADLWAQHPMQDYARIAPLAVQGQRAGDPRCRSSASPRPCPAPRWWKPATTTCTCSSPRAG